jgi:hypothetical protein
MRRLVPTVIVLGVVLPASLAIARGFATSVNAVSATFTATSVTAVQTRTCTNSDGSWIDVTGRYSGTAASAEPTLNGPVTLVVRAQINTTKNLGTIDGQFTVAPSSGKATSGQMTAVYAGGQIAGLVTGGANPALKLVANISASYSSSGGFTNGKLGGTLGGAAVELAPGDCAAPSPAARPPKAEAEGAISAISATSISVGGLTCSIPTSLAATVASVGATPGNQVEIRCQNSVLTRIKDRHGAKHDAE